MPNGAIVANNDKAKVAAEIFRSAKVVKRILKS